RLTLGAKPESIQDGWIVAAIRKTWFEIQELCLTRFRSSYSDVIETIIEQMKKGNLNCVGELGAGAAPLTRLLAERPEAAGWTLVPCDLIRDDAAFRELEAAPPGQVRLIYEPVVFCVSRDGGPNSLLVMMASFPAIPESIRNEVMQKLTESSG